MEYLVLNPPRLLRYLLGYRALLALLALYSIIEKPIKSAVPALVVLGVLVLIGEGIYKNILAYEERRLALQKELELREQRAEEARLRMEAFKRAQEEAAEAFEVFDDESPSAADALPTPFGATEKADSSAP